MRVVSTSTYVRRDTVEYRSTGTGTQYGGQFDRRLEDGTGD